MQGIIHGAQILIFIHSINESPDFVHPPRVPNLLCTSLYLQVGRLSLHHPPIYVSLAKLSNMIFTIHWVVGSSLGFSDAPRWRQVSAPHRIMQASGGLCRGDMQCWRPE